MPRTEQTGNRVDDRYLSEVALTFGLPEIVYGRGSSVRIPEHLSPSELARPFVVTDSNLRRAGVGDASLEALSASGDPIVHTRQPGEPTASEVDGIADTAREAECSSIVAIGGGASMDSAKLVLVLLELGGSIRDHTGEATLDGPASVPLVAVPTTSGTGSETGFGALYIADESREKRPVYSPHLRPTIAVSDPDLSFSVPPATTASTGVDALAQALGPFTGPLRQPIVDALSAEAIRLIVAFLPRAVADGGDIEARVAMAYGSLLSGISMNNTEAMADQFFDEVIAPRVGIAHGIVAGVVLPYVVQFNRDEAPERTALLANLVVEEPMGSAADRADQVVERLDRLRDEIGLPSLKDLGVPRDQLPEFARLTASHYGVEMGINPREVTEAGSLAILESAWEERPPLELSA